MGHPENHATSERDKPVTPLCHAPVSGSWVTVLCHGPVSRSPVPRSCVTGSHLLLLCNFEICVRPAVRHAAVTLRCHAFVSHSYGWAVGVKCMVLKMQESTLLNTLSSISKEFSSEEVGTWVIQEITPHPSVTILSRPCATLLCHTPVSRSRPAGRTSRYRHAPVSRFCVTLIWLELSWKSRTPVTPLSRYMHVPVTLWSHVDLECGVTLYSRPRPRGRGRLN